MIALIFFLISYPWPIKNSAGNFNGPLPVSSTLGDYRKGTKYNPNLPRFHRGIDIPAINGTPVFSLTSDTVHWTWRKDGIYVGKYWYIHLTEKIKEDTFVIGILDDASNPTKIGEVMDWGEPGPRNDHLHFQIGEPSTDGPFYNPLNYIIYNKEVLCLGYL